MKPKDPWQYGVNPNPKNWHEAADALKSRKLKPKRPGLWDRLDKIEQMLQPPEATKDNK